MWVGAIFVLLTLTYLFKNTLMFKFVEHTMVGAAIGHGVVLSLKNVYDVGVLAIPKNPLTILPFIAGLLLFSRLHKTHYYLSRYGMAIMVGIGTGLTMRATIVAQFVAQLRDTILPLTSVDNILIVVGVITTVWYFVFTFESKGPLRHVSRVGLWFMMVAFGVAFGTALIGRITYVISAIRFLLFDWLGITL
jgi:hypothetical protein